jgi:hypothetical protein
MNVYRGVEVQRHALLTLAVHEGERSALCCSHFTSQKIVPRIHLIRGWVGSRTSLIAYEKRKHLVSARNQKIPQCSLQRGHYIDHSFIFLVTVSTNGIGVGYISHNFKITHLSRSYIRIFCGSH